MTDPAHAGQPDSGGRGAAAHGAWRSGRAWVVLTLVTLIGVSADLVSKTIAFRYIGDRPAQTDAFDRAFFAGRFREACRIAAEIRREVHEAGGLRPPAARAVTVIPYVLELSLVYNRGAVFGIGAGKRWAFILFTIAALAFAIWMFGWWTGPDDRAAHVGIGLLIAGGLGNLFDRLVFACVRDFIHPLPGVRLPFGWRMPSGDREIWPYVSNLADLWLILGIGTLMVCLFRQGRKKSDGCDGVMG